MPSLAFTSAIFGQRSLYCVHDEVMLACPDPFDPGAGPIFCTSLYRQMLLLPAGRAVVCTASRNQWTVTTKG